MKFDIQVYSTHPEAPRLNYAVDLVLGNILGISYIITDKPDSSKPIINYSNDRSIGGIFINPEKLLFEDGIRKQDVWVAHLNGLPLFFQQPPEAGFFIDIFAFAFYLVTRYEEYLSFVKDEHGRFAAESSLAYKHDFLSKPVVDIWAIRLSEIIALLYPEIAFPDREYKALMTIDLDQPFAYKGKGLFRNLGGLIIDLFKGRDTLSRFSCLTGRKKDPYDTYDYIEETTARSNCQLSYFFSTGNRSKYDKNPHPARLCYKRLIKRLSSSHMMGLHPSYKSDRDGKYLIKEKKRLEKASDKEVNNVRKHYLLLRFPQTYQFFIEQGFTSDYTLGFVREAGFRAGIARPFKFYDLEKDEVTSLSLKPFMYMDGTFQNYKRYSPEEAIETIRSLINETKAVGGLFISVWHNTSLTEMEEWKGWKQVFEFTVKEQMR